MRACVCSHGLLRRSFCCFDSQCIVVFFCVLFTTTGACACVGSPPVERCIRAVKQVNESVWPVLKRRLDTRRPDGDQKKNTRYTNTRSFAPKLESVFQRFFFRLLLVSCVLACWN